MRTLPEARTIKQTNRQFYDDYSTISPASVKQNHLAYGDMVTIIKKIKEPYHSVDTTGTGTLRGKYGSRRLDMATGGQPVTTDFGRPEELSPTLQRIKVPALVQLSNGTRIVSGGGIEVSFRPSISLSTKIMEEKGITFDPVEDYFEYAGIQYMVDQHHPVGNYLGVVCEIIYEVKNARQK